MKKEEVTKWLTIMKANLNSFPEVSNAKKIEALAEAIRLLIFEQSEEPRGSIAKNDLGVDAISRAEVLKIFDEWFATCDIADKKDSPKIKIKALSSVTPIRPKGHWIGQKKIGFGEWKECIVPLKDGYVTDSCSCSECGEWLTGSDEYLCSGNFCPNCGADMREVKDGKFKD